MSSQDLKRCEGCTFPFGKLVGSRGPIDSPLVIVGEGPGKVEMLKDLPFVGPSGDLLAQALKSHPDIEPYITNATICFPGTDAAKKKEKLPDAVRSCHGRLACELSSHPRQVILALGAPALWSLTGNYGLKITQVRGKVFPSPLAARGIVAATHPAYLLRGSGSLRQFLADVDYACDLVRGEDYRRYVVPKFQVIQSLTELHNLAHYFQSLPEGTPIAADSETGGYSGFDHLRDRILCTGYCVDPSLVYVIPERLVPESRCLYDNRCRFVWHNGKFDIRFHLAKGVPARVDEDTMLLSYTLDEIGGVHDLEQVASDLIGVPDWKYMIQPWLELAKNKHPKGYKVTYADIPDETLYDYMCRDISSTLQIFPILRRQVEANPHLERLYTQTLIPMSAYLVEVELNGLKLDLQQVQKNQERLGGLCQSFEGELNRIASVHGLSGINPRSPVQLLPFLRDTLKLRMPNGGPPRSTDNDTLEKLPQVQFVQVLKKYRKVQKAKSTYVDPAPSWINISGRVHTTYKIHGTRTGRLASADPNLLNIPRDPELRGQFEAEDGNIFLEVDENQAELRVLAWLSSDPELMKVYTIPGTLGIHDTVTIELFGHIKEYTPEHFKAMLEKFNVAHLPPEDWNKELYHEMKMKAKNVNFGIPYGITNVGLADQIEDTPQVAQQYLNKWYKKFPKAWNYILRCRQSVILGERLITPFGRIKRFGAVSREMVNELQNQAANFPMQSIASDIMIHTGLEMRDRIKDPKYGAVKIVNTVYDSILYELPNQKELIDDLARQTIAVVAEKAHLWGMRSVPMKAEAKIGTRWGNLSDYDGYKEVA